MATNYTNSANKVIYPDLSYLLVGIAYSVHNDLGRYCREKQYCDLLEKKLKESNVSYERELAIGNTGNILDFIVEDKIVLEIKSKRMLTREDYFQIQRYLQCSDAKLGLLINFRSNYLKPVRVVKIDTQNKSKFV